MRPEGYPYYHWLQTIEGKGCFELSGERIWLTPGKSVLLTPFTPHSYYPLSPRWSTVYITFGGTAAPVILDALDMNVSACYTETSPSFFSDLVKEMIEKASQDTEFSRYESSTEMYRFLMLLKKMAMRNDRPSLSQYYDKLRPVVRWMERNLASNIGLPEIADQANLSISYLNELFHDAFGVSPYSFLIQLRIREAKTMLITHPQKPLKEVAMMTGFNDVSHFVATFRRKEKMTPAKYRDLHLESEEVNDWNVMTDA